MSILFNVAFGVLVLLDSRLGFGSMRRSTACIHAGVRGNDVS